MAPGPIPPTLNRPGRRHISFSPTQLRVYKDCPERYYRQYIVNERIPAAFNRGTLRGSAVHKSLADAFRRRQQGEIVETIERPVALRYLPRLVYQKAAATAFWDEDLQTVQMLADKGLSLIPSNARILEVERSFSHLRSTRSAIYGVNLVGHVDLVIEHPQGAIEHIEFKTGWAQPDRFQDVICRIGVCEAFRECGIPIFSTTIQLTGEEVFELDGDREVLNRVLRKIEQTVTEIWAAEAWPAQENDRCAFCNYAATLCSARGEWSRPNRLEERAR